MPSWWKTVKARKEHMCIVCRKAITPGTTYLHYTEYYGDGFVNRKMHTDCDDLFDDYLEELGDKVERAEKESLEEPLEFADPDNFYKDEYGEAQWGVQDGIYPG